jgi:hypothetical protein
MSEDFMAADVERKILRPSEVRLQSLLARGYFPSELPPPFGTAHFARHAVEFARKWDGEKIHNKFWTKQENYSVPRYGHARRMLSIVNPVNQLHVSNLISKNWNAIRARLNRSRISEFRARILLRGTARAVSGVNFDGVARRRAEIIGGFGRYVKTDVARFYPSIYTHSIPWAIYGKDYVKSHRHEAAFKDSFANHLDKAVASGQQGQTIGIPIGPDTSRILSELIASEFEISAFEKMHDLEHRAVRYVDDMIVGLKETETAANILSAISIALYEFELELNAEKTLTLGLGAPHAPEWIHYIRTFEISNKAGRQRDDIDSYFEHALYLADANPRDNVLLFAAKRAASFSVDPSNSAHLTKWLLYSARRAPGCLSFVAEHLAAANLDDVSIKNEIKSYILQQIPLKADAVHTDEVAWLLFWAREVDLNVSAELLSRVVLLRSSVVALLVLDLRQRSKIIGKLDTSVWRSAANADGLKSDMWLVAYEATKKGWWKNDKSSTYISDHQYFWDIFTKDVEFYDTKLRARKKILPVFASQSRPVYMASSGEYPDSEV